MFCAMDHRAGWIREKAATTLNPSQVETTLVQLNEQWPANAMSLAEVVEQFPLRRSRAAASSGGLEHLRGAVDAQS